MKRFRQVPVFVRASIPHLLFFYWGGLNEMLYHHSIWSKGAGIYWQEACSGANYHTICNAERKLKIIDWYGFGRAVVSILHTGLFVVNKFQTKMTITYYSIRSMPVAWLIFRILVKLEYTTENVMNAINRHRCTSASYLWYVHTNLKWRAGWTNALSHSQKENVQNGAKWFIWPVR